MFKILNGREHFYQWDLNQKLIVEDTSVNEVHFCTRACSEALVVEVKEEAGARIAEVPNILLQKAFDLKAYAYTGEDYTKHCEIFEIVKRSKPTDYVYTETDFLSLEAAIKSANEYTEQCVEDNTTISRYYNLDIDAISSENLMMCAVQNEFRYSSGYNITLNIVFLPKIMNEETGETFNLLDIPVKYEYTDDLIWVNRECFKRVGFFNPQHFSEYQWFTDFAESIVDGTTFTKYSEELTNKYTGEVFYTLTFTTTIKEAALSLQKELETMLSASGNSIIMEYCNIPETKTVNVEIVGGLEDV